MDAACLFSFAYFDSMLSPGINFRRCSTLSSMSCKVALLLQREVVRLREMMLDRSVLMVAFRGHITADRDNDKRVVRQICEGCVKNDVQENCGRL
jgi:hypothetical protein